MKPIPYSRTLIPWIAITLSACDGMVILRAIDAGPEPEADGGQLEPPDAAPTTDAAAVELDAEPPDAAPPSDAGCASYGVNLQAPHEMDTTAYPIPGNGWITTAHEAVTVGPIGVGVAGTATGDTRYLERGERLIIDFETPTTRFFYTVETVPEDTSVIWSRHLPEMGGGDYTGPQYSVGSGTFEIPVPVQRVLIEQERGMVALTGLAYSFCPESTLAP